MVWTGSPSDYPFSEITGNIYVPDATVMFKKMLFHHHTYIGQCVDKVMSKILNENSEILTKQTWCPIKEKSQLSVIAYREMANLFANNLGIQPTNCLEWIQCFFKMMNKEKKIKTISQEIEHVQIRKYDTRLKQHYIGYQTKTKYKRIQTSNIHESRMLMLNYARSFCSYYKIWRKISFGKKSNCFCFYDK